MADAVWIEFAPGMTAELYEQVNDRVNPSDNRPTGLIFHSAGPSPAGVNGSSPLEGFHEAPAQQLLSVSVDPGEGTSGAASNLFTRRKWRHRKEL